ncbi:hypothetical protein HanIR_Chr14g0704411 [Helianthus annuus]|nr:hypothetical protein HanIR_Chr14g0704411 [Helianthus annuus]
MCNPWSGSLLPLPSSYPSIPEDTQMSGPSNTAPITESPSTGYDNPIPTYLNLTGSDTTYTAAATDYNYPAPSYDPYMQAVIQNDLYPPTFPPSYQNPGYPNPGYLYPVIPQPPQPPPQQQLPLKVINQRWNVLNKSNNKSKRMNGGQAKYSRNYPR